ncbi:MAG: ATP-dependent DNA helicase [Candidatus Saccharimonadales bacterium]
MAEFKQVYKSLNKAQRRAVDTIDGPVLVVAGPGTGKTQLLSARVAHILESTDTLPQNILCMTFTENGALNIRERLTSFIGQAAYDVNISTYHAFGSNIINRFSEYFSDLRLESPVDTLGRHQIIDGIVSGLNYNDPLKQSRHHLGDLISTISDAKRALLTPKIIIEMSDENEAYLASASQEISQIFAGISKMPSKYSAAEGYFTKIRAVIQAHAPKNPANKTFGSLASLTLQDLDQALDEAASSNSTKPLTAWKNKWLIKDPTDQFILAGKLENKRLRSLASVLESYQKELAKRGLYDFDDMILASIKAIEQNDELRFSLQEQYLYIMLDEYQDTNAAQARLIDLLTNNPTSEGRPNVMAVGDDDQAIYAFQGAQFSNMLDFYKSYRDVAIINLHENYRSAPEILTAASLIAGQIKERLFDSFDDLTKDLTAANSSLPKPNIERRDFQSNVAEYAYVAKHVAEQIENGVEPRQIAVLAPRHVQLEGLVRHLQSYNLPVRYDKRENILDSQIVAELVAMANLAVSLSQADFEAADSLWPQILSFEFWNIPTVQIWQTAFSIGKGETDQTNWTESLLGSADEHLRSVALFFVTLAGQTSTERLEIILDYLIGTNPLILNDESITQFESPLKDYYLNLGGSWLHDMLSNLTVLRTKLRDYQATEDRVLKLENLLELITAYQAADEPMLNTSPYNQSGNSIQLMTVYKAKGLEFDQVYLLSVNNETWNGGGSSNKLTLPANVMPIRHSGASEDERLRLLFVALTRAKTGLTLTNSLSNYSGKATSRLKFLDEQPAEGDKFVVGILEPPFNLVKYDDFNAPDLEILQTDWRARHLRLDETPLSTLLEDRIKNYQLSPTHLNTFCDLIYGGPDKFFINTILRFPSAPSVSGEFGNAIHESLQWFQNQLNLNGSMPNIDSLISYFSGRMRHRKLTENETKLLLERGSFALTAFIEKRGQSFVPGSLAEKNFKNEGVFVDEAHLSGKIDRLDIDTKAKTITVIDYKTGPSFTKWKSDAKLHKYLRQLYCYKLLIEGSHSYKGYKVTSGRLEFIEPDSSGVVNYLSLDFADDELAKTKQLLITMWQHVQTLNMPDVSQYNATIVGIRQLEDDLINNKI